MGRASSGGNRGSLCSSTARRRRALRSPSASCWSSPSARHRRRAPRSTAPNAPQTSYSPLSLSSPSLLPLLSSTFSLGIPCDHHSVGGYYFSFSSYFILYIITLYFLLLFY